jgi:hypothetical protein
VLVVPGLTDSNLALFTLITDTLPSWLLGVVGAAAALSSIVPMAVFMLVIGTMWTHSRGPADEGSRRLAQLVTLLAGVVALGMTYLFPNALARLSVLSYEGMAQLLPLTLLALLGRRLPLPRRAERRGGRGAARRHAGLPGRRPALRHQRRPGRTDREPTDRGRAHLAAPSQHPGQPPRRPRAGTRRTSTELREPAETSTTTTMASGSMNFGISLA